MDGTTIDSCRKELAYDPAHYEWRQLRNPSPDLGHLLLMKVVR